MKFQSKIIKISCDGGGATGKTTGAKMAAKKYNLKFLSSGLLYRYTSFLLIKNNPKNKIVFLKKKFKKLDYKKLDKINLHTPEISKMTSDIAKINKVRQVLKSFQIKFSNRFKSCCIEGRDISTKIMAQFPSKVNLIEFNSWPGVKFQPTERKDIEKFSKFIQDKGYMSFIRRSRGDDVLAACGQLRTESEKKSKPN